MCIIQSKFSRTNPQTLKWRRGVCVRRSWIRPCCVTPTKRLDRVDTSDLKDMADGSHFLWNFRFRGGVSLESALYKINVWCKLKFLHIKQFLPQIWCQYNVFLCKKRGGGCPTLIILYTMNQVFIASVIQFSITIIHLEFRNDNVLVNKTHSLNVDFMVNQFERVLIRTKIVYICIYKFYARKCKSHCIYSVLRSAFW